MCPAPKDENKYTLIVKDNGQGFELSGNTDDLPRSGKMGLMGMKERVWLLNGTIDIDSSPGVGTCLRIFVPA